MAMAASHLELGEHGEDLAVRALERAGYAIVARRYRVRAGEIDIVAMDGRCLVFVEVKTRRGGRCGAGAEAVTLRKRRKICAVAAEFLARHAVAATSCRFDVVEVAAGDARPRVDIIRNAFDAL
jgi:putative endonuclease